MFNGKMKAGTFSYDDGVTQDQKLIEIFDKYNLNQPTSLNVVKGKQLIRGYILLA